MRFVFGVLGMAAAAVAAVVVYLNVAGATRGITVSLLGQTLSFAPNCQSLDLDGASLLGRQTTVTLGGKQHHDLRIDCG